MHACRLLQRFTREAVRLVLEIRDMKFEYFFTMTPPLTPCELFILESLLELSCSLSSDGLSVECSSLLDGVVSLIYNNCSLNNQSSTVCKFTPIIIPYRYIRIVYSFHPGLLHPLVEYAS